MTLMSRATVIHRFITDLNPIQAEWIVVRAGDAQCDPDDSLESHLQNPLCGTALPANGRLDEPTNLSLELKRGNRTLTLHGFEVVRDAEAPSNLVRDLTGLDTTVRMVYLRGPDGHQVELLQYHGPADKDHAHYRPCDTAAAHIAIRVDNVPAAVAAAENVGLKRLNQIITAKRSSGTTQSCYLRDPDGITIEILSRST